MVPNINVKEVTDKRIGLVYNKDISGYQALDFAKIDDIEDILQSGVNVNKFSDVIFSSGDLPSGVVVYQSNLNKDLDNVTAIVSGFNDTIFSSGDLPTGVIVYQANLNKDLDNVTSFPEKSDSISNFSPSDQNGLILQANPNRKELYIQNLSTNPLYVKYGNGAALNSFNFILSKNTSENAGDGGSISDQGYSGPVSVFAATSTPKYISWERV